MRRASVRVYVRVRVCVRVRVRVCVRVRVRVSVRVLVLVRESLRSSSEAAARWAHSCSSVASEREVRMVTAATASARRPAATWSSRPHSLPARLITVRNGEGSHTARLIMVRNSEGLHAPRGHDG